MQKTNTNPLAVASLVPVVERMTAVASSGILDSLSKLRDFILVPKLTITRYPGAPLRILEQNCQKFKSFFNF